MKCLLESLSGGLLIDGLSRPAGLVTCGVGALICYYCIW